MSLFDEFHATVLWNVSKTKWKSSALPGGSWGGDQRRATGLTEQDQTVRVYLSFCAQKAKVNAGRQIRTVQYNLRHPFLTPAMQEYPDCLTQQIHQCERDMCGPCKCEHEPRESIERIRITGNDRFPEGPQRTRFGVAHEHGL